VVTLLDPPGGGDLVLYWTWDGSLPQVGTIEETCDDGATWNLVSDVVVIGAGSQSWTSGCGIDATVKARIRITGTAPECSSVSDPVIVT
jgi:hypothetical protein